MNQKELDTYYIKVAKICAENSKANRLKVGSVLVKNNQIISDGFNGTPSGFENECENEICSLNNKKECSNHSCKGCEYLKLKTKPYVLHAESNCLMKSLKHGNSTYGATIYITHAPCVECSKLIIQSGINRVVYLNDYKTDEGIKLLHRANISVNQFIEDND